MRLIIKEIIGPRCIIKDDGQKIYEMIYPRLKNGEDVFLDFSDVSQFASPFFNLSVGQLLKDIPESDLRRLIHIESLNQVGQKVVERVIEAASLYYKNVDFRKIVDSILEQQAKGDN